MTDYEYLKALITARHAAFTGNSEVEDEMLEQLRAHNKEDSYLEEAMKRLDNMNTLMEAYSEYVL